MKRFTALLLAAMILLGLGIYPTGVQAATPIDRQDFSGYAVGVDLTGAFSDVGNMTIKAVADPDDASNICAHLDKGPVDNGIYYANFQPSTTLEGKVTVEFRTRVADYAYRHLPNIHTSTGGYSEMLIGEINEESIRMNGIEVRARLELNQWMHYKYEIDTNAGTYVLYLNGSTEPSLMGNLKINGPVADVSFQIWGSPMYLDDFAMYQTPQKTAKHPAYYEDFDYAAGTQLSAVTNMYSEGTVRSAQVVKSGDTDMAFLSTENNNYASMILDLTEENFTGPFTVEMRTKLATMGWAELKVNALDNGADVQLTKLEFTDGRYMDLLIRDELNDNAAVGSYIADVNPDSPDFDKGWQTLRIYVNPTMNTVTVTIEGQAQKYTRTIDISDAVQLKEVEFTGGPGISSRADIYVDWIRVVPGQALTPGPLASEAVFTQDFEDATAGGNLLNYALVADNGVSVTAAADPKGSGSVCAEIKESGIAGDYGAHASIPLGEDFQGKVTLSFRAYLEEACYRHLFCIFSTSGKELLVAQTYDDGYFSDGSYQQFEPGVWHELRYEIDTEAGTIKRYLDNTTEPVLLTIDANEVINQLMFGVWKADGKNTAFYIDDIKIEKKDGTYTEVEKAAQLESGRRMIEIMNSDVLEGAAECNIPRGGYRIKTDSMFKLENVSNFTVDGNDSELWFASEMNGVALYGCTNVTVRGFRADYDPLPFSQGTIVALYPETKFFDLKIDEGYRMPDASWNGGMRAIFYNADGTQEVPATCNDSAWWQSVVNEEERIVRFAMYTGDIFNYDMGVQPGDKFICLDSGNGIGLVVDDGNSNTIENFDLYSSWNFAIADGGGEGNNTYRNLRLIPRPGTDRLIASNSDGLHSARTKIGPKVYNSEISHTADDLVNIQGFFDYIYRQESDNVIDVICTFGRSFEEGSEVNFYDVRSWDALGGAKVVSYEQITDSAVIADATNLPAQLREQYGIGMRDISPEVWRVTLDRAVDVEKYNVLESQMYTGSSAVFEDSSFHDGHVRGILLRSPGGVVKDCTFENINGPAICIAPERYWAEGPFPNNITIVGNTMRRTSVGIDSRRDTPGAITVFATVTEDGVAIKNNHNIANITIEDNNIIDSGALGIFMSNTDNAIIRNNTIDGIYIYGQSTLAAERWAIPKFWYGIYITNSDNATIEGNTFVNMPDFATGEIYDPSSGVVWLPMEDLDAFGSGWVITGATLATATMQEKGSYNGGNCLVVTPDSDSAHIKHSLIAPLTEQFVVSFMSKLSEGNVSLPALYDENGNKVFELYFDSSNTLYGGGKQLSDAKLNEWHTYTIYFDTTANTWEVYREADKLGDGEFTADKISALEFAAAGTGEILLDNVAVYGMSDIPTASAEWSNSGVTVKVNNQYGEAADIYAVVHSSDNIVSAVKRQVINAGYVGSVNIDLPGADTVFVWRGMEPLLPVIKDENKADSN